MTRWMLLAALVLSACSSGEAGVSNFDGDTDVDPNSLEGADDAVQAIQLRVDVLPPAGLTDRQGDDLALPPHTFVTAARTPLDAVLHPSVELSGYVTGYATTPYAPSAALPGETGPVDATVQILAPDTVMGTITRTEDDGFYVATVAPAVYRLAIVPTDPAYPLSLTPELEVLDGGTLDLQTSSGHPVWGVISNSVGAPLEGVEVVLVSQDGVEGPPTFTDAEGRYTLYAGEGTFHVVARGRNNGRDPSITTTDFALDALGAKRDIQYGPLDLVSIGGRMVRPTGSGVSGATLRLVAEDLVGYTGTDAAITVEIPADGSGNFDARVVAGTYRVELLPPPEAALSPVSLGSVDLTATVDLGTVQLPGLQLVSGLAVDALGQPLPGATLRATEVGFDRRYFSTTTDELGQFSFEVPAVDVDLLLTPPGARPDLAATRQRLGSTALAGDAFPTIGAVEGTLVEGQVTWDDGDRVQPLAFGIVQVYAANGDALGQALTDADGAYALRVDLSAYE